MNQELHESRSWKEAFVIVTKERDALLARVAELEAALQYFVIDSDCWPADESEEARFRFQLDKARAALAKVTK